jgi:hypothetical protein
MPRGQQKVIFAKEDLPPVGKLSDGSYGYVARYRIISEDQNRYSSWAPIRELPVPEPILVSGAVVANGSIVQVAWGDSEKSPSYDVFIKSDSNDYVYHGTTTNHNYSFLAEYETSTVTVAIQIESIEKERADFITIFESPETDLV